MGKTKRIIGIVVGLCDEHACYSVCFPCKPYGLMIAEGDGNALDVESQLFLSEGAALITEIDEKGTPIKLFCPKVTPCEIDSQGTMAGAIDWIKSVRRVVGYGKGYEDLDVEDLDAEKDFVLELD